MYVGYVFGAVLDKTNTWKSRFKKAHIKTINN